MLLLRQLLMAWRMLRHNRNRFCLSVLGIAFAVVIMFMEMGFFHGLNDSQANLAPLLDADLLLSSKWKNHLKSGEEITVKRLRQVLALDGVRAVTPLYTNAMYWWNPQDGSRNRVLVIAVSLEQSALLVPEIAQYAQALRAPDTILYDRLSRRELGDILIGTRSKLHETFVTVVGQFSLGPNFAYEGHVITSHENFYRFFGGGESDKVADQISLGLIQLHPGVDAQAFKGVIQAHLPDDFLLLTRAEIEAREKDYTTRHSPSGVVFGVGVLVGVAIGVIICYQILFNEVQDHLAQFATLKALGYRPAAVAGLVLCEGLVLSFVGFLTGLLCSWGLYGLLEHFTQIIMAMTPGRIGVIFLLTTGMCLLAGGLAIHKVMKADPADLY